MRCARCHAEAQEAELVACPVCATRLHAECRAEAPGCTTLGCAQSVRRPRTRPWEPPPPPPMSCRACLLWMLGALASLVVAWCWYGLTHVAEVAIRNDSGRVLRNVRVDGYQYEASPELRHAEAVLLPGSSVVLHGGWSGYELQLRQVTVDGVAVISSADARHSLRFATMPGQHSLLAIDQDLRLRTIVLAILYGPTPCLCPNGNVSRAGSAACQILGHHTGR